MANDDTLFLGAVAYDPKVVTIWEGFKEYFAERGLAFDFVLYSNYERQVEGHFRGEYDVAWNSPLAWVEASRLARARGRKAEALAMRDTDRDLTSLIVVRADGPSTLEELRGKSIAVGASDSPQGTLIPLEHLAAAGVEPGRDVEVLRHELMVGKHGDHIGGEREAAKALVEGRADAACMIDMNHLLFGKEGTLPQGKTKVLAQTAPYDHCNFTALDGAPAELLGPFKELLFAMSYDDPKVRPLLDLEGLKKWEPGRTEGYAQLEAAVDRFGTIDAWLKKQQS